MFQAHVDGVASARRAVILIVVLALLALFAVIGLSFAFYANSAARTAQLAREAENQNTPDVEPELLLSYFLGQLIYDTDDKMGIYSAMRGHGLARTMYGLNYDPATNMLLPNNVPFNGTGRLHTSPAMTAPPFFSKLAFDASNDDWNGPAPSGISNKVMLPPNDKKTFTCFPVYQNGYAGDGSERLNHPLLFNVFQPMPNDRAFALSNMEALLRYGDTGSPALPPTCFAPAR
jgi:hypothetical protein